MHPRRWLPRGPVQRPISLTIRCRILYPTTQQYQWLQTAQNCNKTNSKESQSTAKCKKYQYVLSNSECRQLNKVWREEDQTLYSKACGGFYTTLLFYYMWVHSASSNNNARINSKIPATLSSELEHDRLNLTLIAGLVSLFFRRWLIAFATLNKRLLSAVRHLWCLRLLSGSSWEIFERD